MIISRPDTGCDPDSDTEIDAHSHLTAKGRVAGGVAA